MGPRFEMLSKEVSTENRVTLVRVSYMTNLDLIEKLDVE